MVKQKVDKRAKTINLKSNSNKEFFLIHGYTGSPTDFNNLPYYLNKRFNANVKVIRLKGHGEKIDNIDDLKYEDFFLQAENELKKDIKNGMQIVIGGISMGSFIALHLASKYPIKGIFNISIPYKNKFLTEIVAFVEPLIPKKHWKKTISDDEKELRAHGFFYDTNIKGLNILKKAKKELKKALKKITAPSFIIHVLEDKIFHLNGVISVQKNINSHVNEIFIFDGKKAGHNPFYSPNHKELYNLIGDFVEKNNLFEKIK